MTDKQFLIPLEENTVLSWTRVQQLYDLSLTDRPFFRFGAATGIPVEEFSDLSALRKQFQLKDRIYVIRMNGQFKLPIHVDGEPGCTNAASIIWPLMNCDERSPTSWYSLEEERRRYEVVRGSYFLVNSDEAKPLHQEAMHSSRKSPYLFRSDMLHRGINETDAVRVIVKWEMSCDSWDQAVQEVTKFGFLRSQIRSPMV